MQTQYKPFTIILSTILILTASTVLAENLIEIYNLAKDFDPIMQAAIEQNKAELEALPQARALFLPTISASANTMSNKVAEQKYNTWNNQLTVSQSLIQLQNWCQLKQAKNKVKASIATLADTEQAFLLRIAEQYFAVLKAKDDLNFAQAKRKAFARYLEQTKQRFKVGLIATTDVNEAQAKHDNAVAQEIAAENLLANEKENLREITGQEVLGLAILKDSLPLKSPIPNEIEQWVKTATEKNWKLEAARFNLVAVREKIKESNTGHLPTLKLDANINRNKHVPSSTTPIKSNDRNIGLTLTVPIFNGGSTFSKTKEARYNYEKASKELEQQYKSTESKARQAYRGVLTQISQVNAFKQAVVSGESALKATQAAFKVGTRTVVDVLNAESDLLDAKRNHYKARYDYILQSLRLKQTAGSLSVQDLREINNWLK